MHSLENQEPDWLTNRGSDCHFGIKSVQHVLPARAPNIFGDKRGCRYRYVQRYGYGGRAPYLVFNNSFFWWARVLFFND